MNKLAAFKPYILSQNSSHLSLSGNVTKRKEFVSAAAEELRIFLEPYKRKYISQKELYKFYDENFPNLHIHLNSPNDTGLNETRFYPSSYNSRFNCIRIDVSSAGFIKQLKESFKIKSNPKKSSDDPNYYVNKTFIEMFVHENTHVMQEYLKPTILTSRKSFAENSDTKSSYYSATFKLKEMEEVLYQPFLLISMGMFITQYLTDKKCNAEVDAAILKECIRTLQKEREAFMLGTREKRKAFSISEKTKNYSTKFDNFMACFDIPTLYFFRTKEKILKQLYAHKIKQIRNNRNLKNYNNEQIS